MIGIDFGNVSADLLESLIIKSLSEEEGDGVPNYFFIVKWPDQELDDPEGTRLPTDGDALKYAKRLIREIREGGEPDEPQLTMTVKNAVGETVFSIPF